MAKSKDQEQFKKSAQRYRRQASEFAKSGAVESGSRKARRAAEGEEAKDLVRAEEIAKRHAADTDPKAPRDYAQPGSMANPATGRLTEDEEAEARERLWGMIADIQTGMMTTADAGVLRARPMIGYPDPYHANLWFFTRLSDHKAQEINARRAVCLAYGDPKNKRYVSVSGTAKLVRDRVKIKEFWSPFVGAWFPEGRDDPDVALIKVDAEQAEYWDGPSSKIVQLWRFATAKLAGKEPHLGENEKVTLGNADA